jgi:hypothetical protein
MLILSAGQQPAQQIAERRQETRLKVADLRDRWAHHGACFNSAAGDQPPAPM